MSAIELRNAEIIRLIHAGRNRQEVASRFSLKPKSITNLVWAAGASAQTPHPKPARIQIAGSANELYKKGMTRDDIALELGVSRSTVDKAVKPCKRGLARLALALPLDGSFSDEALKAEKSRLASGLRYGQISKAYSDEAHGYIAKACLARACVNNLPVKTSE